MKFFTSLLVSIFAVSSFAAPLAVFAHEGENSQEAQEHMQQKKDELHDRVATRAAIRKEKLEKEKEKVCEVHKKVIKNRSTKMGEGAFNQFKVFQSIAKRVDDYYNNKLVPRGVIVPNYDALKDDIQDKKDAVQVAVDAAKTAATNFDCAGDDPKGQLATFKEDMKEVIQALKDYRVSIKNFIVAIRTAKASAEATHSATKSGEH